jgi:hypothetical protein
MKTLHRIVSRMTAALLQTFVRSTPGRPLSDGQLAVLRACNRLGAWLAGRGRKPYAGPVVE